MQFGEWKSNWRENFAHIFTVYSSLFFTLNSHLLRIYCSPLTWNWADKLSFVLVWHRLCKKYWNPCKYLLIKYQLDRLSKVRCLLWCKITYINSDVVHEWSFDHPVQTKNNWKARLVLQILWFESNQYPK